MKPNATQTAAALAMALMLISAGAGGATATAPSVDATTHAGQSPSTTSEVTDTSTLGANNSFSANGSNASLIQYQADSNDSKVYIDAKGTTVYENTSSNLLNWNSSDGHGHFNVSVSHDALADMEHGIGEKGTTTWYITNNTSVSSPDETNISVYVEWNNETTVQNIDDSDVDEEDIVEVTNETGPAGTTFSFLGETTADVETEDREVNGSETDVVIALSNDTVQDMFDEGVSEASSGDKLSKLWKGTRTVATVSDDDQTVAVPVFYEEASDDVDEDDTYAVYKQVGGTWALSVNLGDEFEDSDEVSVNAIGSAGASTMFLEYTFNGAGSTMFNTGALLGMVPIVAGRRRRDGVYADAEADTQAAA